MRVTFCGAAGAVTGSCYLVETESARFLVDCGLFQGDRQTEALNGSFTFDPGQVDQVILTHAHIDHSGRLPLLHRLGFAGPIWATPATADLAGIMLPDSAHLQEVEAEWHNRKRRRAGEEPVEPLYGLDDASRCLQLFRPVAYEQTVSPAPGIRLRFRDAGHILGSAIAEVWVEEEGRETKLVFSGDLGNPGRPILQDPTLVDQADVLFLESTYGDRSHGGYVDQIEALAEVVRSVAADGGNLIIPAFAVGRTQDLLYYLNKLQEAGRVPELPVYVDSPLATSATQIFRRHQECFDQEARDLLAAGDDPFSFPGLTYVRSPQDSMALNQMSGAIIISASGMANAGRVLHHLKHNLWRPESTVLFVGYQAEGTLGRALLGGVRDVHVLGEAISVRAKIRQLSGFSAHADQAGLMAWARGLDRPPAVTFVVHGEQSGAEALAGLLKEAGHRPRIPALGDSLDIARDAEGTLVISDGERRAVSVELAAPARRGNGLEREVGSALAALRRFRQVLVTGQYNGEQNGIAYTDLWKELRRALKDVGLVMARAERRSRHGEDH